MSGKCTSPNCNRKSDGSNTQNLCVLCYDWFLKCQTPEQPQFQSQANYQELVNIYNNLANGVHVDHNIMMRALFGSMLSLINQNEQVSNLKKEIQTHESNFKDLENVLTETKIKVYNLEYDMKSLEKENLFTSEDTLVIRKLERPEDGDDKKKVKEVLSHLELLEVDLEEDIIAVERKGCSEGRLGSVCVKLVNGETKKQIMKKKKELLGNANEKVRDIKIVNYKPPEHIIFENALRSVLALVPNGERYELNGNMRLVTKQD